MSKTRNFFLAVWGFLLIAVVFFFFVELVWLDEDSEAAILSAPATKVIEPTAIHQGDPSWLIPYEQIAFYCEHPWVIRRKISLADLDIDLVDAGLSECYQWVGEGALESHLWQQGVKSLALEQGKTVELFFDYDANFDSLGLEPPETVVLSGKVVHDLNGDAVFNPGEPIISGAKICINREPLSLICTRSDQNGKYVFRDILPGAWYFRIESPSTERFKEFKYTNQLIEADHRIPETTFNGYTISERFLNLTEFNAIESEILVLVNGEKEYDFFLMHEWATYFAAPKDADQFQTTAYYDLDVRPGLTRVYNGENDMTYDQHDGLDSSCPRGTEIVSVAEGLVIAIMYDSTVAIRHSNQLISVYGHGDPLVVENQFVPRGYPVALCNNHLTKNRPHLHFAVWQSTSWLNRVSYGIPAFADLKISEEKWIVNHHPLEKDYFVYMLQGGRGVWTEINQPHLPYVRLAED
jgi:murein DD-endopeptidase MepM/ murein hydrolase activator NlpD